MLSEIPSVMGGMDIFWNHTISINILVKLKMHTNNHYFLPQFCVVNLTVRQCIFFSLKTISPTLLAEQWTLCH